MNLIFGRRISGLPDQELLREIYRNIRKTLEGPPLDTEIVISACVQLCQRLEQPESMASLLRMGVSEEDLSRHLVRVQKQLSREQLTSRLKRELGTEQGAHTRAEWLPLGTLLCITSGNAYGLAAYCVLEGLLTGNITMLKLPGEGDEVSLLLLEWLMEAEPELAEYIYVLGFHSTDIKLLLTFARMADAVVVWGSDEAVKAVRSLAAPNIRLIEWGHKMGFAYIEPGGVTDGELQELALHMCRTRQLSCTSCQGIYLDSDDVQLVQRFALNFLDILAAVSGEALRAALSHEQKAQLALKLRSREIEAALHPEQGHLYRRGQVSVRADSSKGLESSDFFGNCWVKPLPKNQILRVLKPYKSYLQAAALYCRPEHRVQYENRLFQAGVGRITTARKLDGIDFSLPHDGEYSLRKYSRMVLRH